MFGHKAPFLAVILTLALAGGCAHSGSAGGPLAWLPFSGSAAAVADAKTPPDKSKGSPKPADEVAAAEKKPSKPAEKTETKTASADSKPAEKTESKPAEEAKVADAKPAEKPADKPAGDKTAGDKTAGDTQAAAGGGLTHDAETLAIIDEELRTCEPAERERLYQEWKGLDGPMVRQIIRIRRMVRDLDAAAVAQRSQTGQTGSALPSDPGMNQPGARTLNAGASSGVQLASGIESGPDEDVRNAGFAFPDQQSIRGIETIGGVAANGPPAAPPAEPVIPTISGVSGPAAASGNNGQSGQPGPPALAADGQQEDPAWKSRLSAAIVAAESRAEQARAAFLDRPPGSPPADDLLRRQYLETQVDLRMMYLIDGQQGRAMQAIPAIDPAEQEFWQQVIWGVANYFDERSLPNRADRVSQAVQQLRAAIAKIQSEANLELRNVAFCHKITSFGNYERFDRDEYSPGQRVLIYSEIVNFKSVPQPSDGMYRTQLKSTIEIYRAGESQPMSKIDFPETVDLCRSYRQDYFHSYELKIPTKLALGPHVLKLTIHDSQSGKVATYSINFTVK